MIERGLTTLMCAAIVTLAVGCAQTPTELVVIVDTDMSPGFDIDSIEIDVEPHAGHEQMRTGALTGSHALSLPVTLDVVDDGGALDGLVITAIASNDGMERVRAQAKTSLIRGERQVLRLALTRACVDVSCHDDETCRSTDGTCESVDVTTAAWSGTPERFINVCDAEIPISAPSRMETVVADMTFPCSGMYKLAGFVWGMDGGTDSFYIDVDMDPARMEYRDWDLQDTTSYSWEDVTWRGSCDETCAEFMPKVWAIDNAGIHEIYLGDREIGTRIRELHATFLSP